MGRKAGAERIDRAVAAVVGPGVASDEQEDLLGRSARPALEETTR